MAGLSRNLVRFLSFSITDIMDIWIIGCCLMDMHFSPFPSPCLGTHLRLTIDFSPL